jgi:hypothetical protein
VWVLAKGDPAAFRRALAACAEGHRDPVYACMYACARDAAHARDLTQTFFASLREAEHLPVFRPADLPRMFLQACVLHFLFNDPGHEVRRGGDGETVIAFRTEPGEPTRRPELVDVETLKRIFDRAWAAQILGDVFKDMRRDGVDDTESKVLGCVEAYVNGSPEVGETDSQLEEQRRAGEFLLNEILKPDPPEDEDDSA